MSKVRYLRYRIQNARKSYTYYVTEPVYDFRDRWTCTKHETTDWVRWHLHYGSAKENWRRYLRGEAKTSWRNVYAQLSHKRVGDVYENFEDTVRLQNAYDDDTLSRYVQNQLAYIEESGTLRESGSVYVRQYKEYKRIGEDVIEKREGSLEAKKSKVRVKVDERQVPKQGIRDVQERGEYIDRIVAEEGEYPDDGIQGNYWYVKQEQQLRISGNSDIGMKTGDFWIEVRTEGHLPAPEVTRLKAEMNGRLIHSRILQEEGSQMIQIKAADYSTLRFAQTQEVLITLYDELQSATLRVIFSRGNQSPTISGEDTDLGPRNESFSVSYEINDPDNLNSLKVTEMLNKTILRTVSNAPRGQQSITISKEKLLSLQVNELNVIEVKVEDADGGVAFRRWTFTRSNSAPVISGTDNDLGEKRQEFTVNFSATDPENDEMTAKVYLDDVLFKDYGSINSGQEYAISFDKIAFSKVKHGEPHKIKIEVKDSNHATSVRSYTFTRSLDRLSYIFKKETDQKVGKVIITPTWQIADGAVAKVEVSNNAKDTSPTWENMTTQVMEGRHFNIQNNTKTADEWMLGVKITIEKQANETSWLGGFGGGYK